MVALSTTPIVALDVGSAHAALAIVEELGDSCDFYKVGNELFTAEGPGIVRALHAAHKRVFLDLKLHDIPNTVRKASQSAAQLDVALLTVHASGGAAMLAAAREGAGEQCGILAVTVLTSHDQISLGLAWGKVVESVDAEVDRLAGLAAAVGVHGVVCSGYEIARIRRAHADRLATLVPGVRFAGGASQDQARVVTPEQAAAAGARYVILGRAVTDAIDRRGAMERAIAELSRGPAR
jgi:orotidine-5'-phosphate decarboxylase